MNKLTGPLAIIGAGASGLTLASDWPHSVTVFEKSRGVGGRMSTRRKDNLRFDHGLPLLKTNLDSSPFIIPWEGQFVPVPQANSWCKHKAENLNIKTDFKVELLKYLNGAWWICSENDDIGPFETVVLTAPPTQSYELLPVDFAHKQDILKAQMHSCFMLMVTCKKQISSQPPLWPLSHSILQRITHENSKPQREDLPVSCFVAQSRFDWAQEHLEDDLQEIQKILLADFFAGTQLSTFDVESSEVHRWRYAVTAKPIGVSYFWDERLRIGVCGDWLLGGAVEDAVASAKALSKKLLTLF